MIDAFAKAVGQLPDPAFRRVLMRGLGMTLALFVVLVLAVPLAIGTLGLKSIPWLAAIPWLGGLLEFGGFVVAVVISLLIFPAVATLLISFLSDDIVDAVEARHYPGQGSGRRLAVGQSLAVAGRFTGLVLLANLVMLPIYLLLSFFPPITLFVLYGLNGYLLSREYFELVALRHLDRAPVARLRKANRGKLFVAGVVIAGLLTSPLLPILAPRVAAAFMVHVFRDINARGVT